MNTASFLEDHISQIPALQELINLGYSYIPPSETVKQRQGKLSNVILEDILREQLKKINGFNYKGQDYAFADNNIQHAINTLKEVPILKSVVLTNEEIYELLTLGKSFEENIEGDKKSFTLNYIDWHNIHNNVFHVTDEFQVLKRDGKNPRRPDIVCFVNGIPFVVIECKRPDIKEPIEEAVSQNIRNQNSEEEIPQLFIYTQIILAICKNEAKYATVGTHSKFWSLWKEKKNDDNDIDKTINQPLANTEKEKLFQGPYKYVKEYFDDIEKKGRLLTVQDRVIYFLLRPERLVELSYQFIVFDKGIKKIARYQQYFAVKNTLDRVKQFAGADKRQGGVIWHTQGSGKSLTMVMLAKALALDPEIVNPRIILVTDRIDLDTQLCDTFRFCGMEPVKAESGANLLALLEKNKHSIITSVIDKFTSASDKSKNKITSGNIFVLVDESHRSQYGTANTKMQLILPNACYIGFTGTPILKKNKNTLERFGGFIDKYTIEQAVEDKAVVPLLYEGRHVLQEVNKTSIDKWFERVCSSLTDEQKVDLKKKFSRIEKLNETDKKIYMIAYDISEHFAKNCKGTGYKAQLACSSKLMAIKYKDCFDEIGMLSSEVMISSPEQREGYDEVDADSKSEVGLFWKKMMNRFNTEEAYNLEIIRSFINGGPPDIIIVVDKLLTGFDAPRNTYLYLAKSLKDHSLLQAIARVNRVYEGKDFGFIIDYVGILGNLDDALTSYSALAGFDEEDMLGTLSNVNAEVEKLPQKYSELWDIFKTINNKQDEEEYEQFLADEQLRQKFYKKLSAYSKCAAIALSTTKFYEENSKNQIIKYKDDLKFFQKLRVSLKKRYSEVVDYKEYEAKIQKLLNEYVSSDEVIQLTEQVNIFDKEKFQDEIEKLVTTVGKADTVASRTKKTITEKFDEDPVFYKKFSKLLEEAILAYREKRIDEAEYFQTVMDIMDNLVNRKDDDVPDLIKARSEAKAFYGIVFEKINAINSNKNNGHSSEELKEISAEIGLSIDNIILDNKIVDWHLNQDIQNKIIKKLDDYLLDHPKIELNYDDVDLIIERVMDIAKKRYQ